MLKKLSAPWWYRSWQLFSPSLPSAKARCFSPGKSQTNGQLISAFFGWQPVDHKKYVEPTGLDSRQSSKARHGLD